MAELGEKKREWERSKNKEGEYKEISKKIARCEKQIGKLKSVERGQVEVSFKEVDRIRGKIEECSRGIDKSLKEMKRAVGSEL
jgi:hypothetical protein